MNPKTKLLLNHYFIRLALTSIAFAVLLASNVAASYDPLDNWQWRIPKENVAYPALGITYANNIFVAAGRNWQNEGAILTSQDGATWTLRHLGTTSSLFSVAYGNGTYVAVGNVGSIITSPDSITWTPIVTYITQGLHSVTFGNNIFVAVGDNNRVLTSPDGITWTPRTFTNDNCLIGIAYGNNTFVAVGTPHKYLVSPDGITWTSGTLPIAGDDIYKVVYGKNIFVGVGINSTIVTSPDGITWTLGNSGTTTNLYGITYGNNIFLAVGDFGTVLTSPDGVTWTKRNSGTSYALDSVAYGKGTFVIVAGDGILQSDPLVDKGDVNRSGKVELADAILSLQISADIITASTVYKQADVNGDQKIGIAEAIYALQCIARLRNNHSPVLATIGNKSVDESSNLTFTLSATDEDNDPLTFSVSPLPRDATFNASSRIFSWTPTYSQSGTYQVTFTSDDGYGGTDSETITITVMDKVPVFTASEYYPLNVGDWKDYYLNTIGNVKRSSVTGTKIIGGVTTKITLRPDGDYRDYYTSDQNGVKLYGAYATASALETIFNPPILLIPNTAQIGTSKVSTSQYLFIYLGYTYHVNVTSTVIIWGLEDIQTEHSLLQDCIKVSRKTDQYIEETGESVPGDTYYYWFYKGIGAVKQTDGSDTYTITSSNINGVIQNY